MAPWIDSLKLFDDLDIGLIFTDIVTCRIQRVNEAACRLLGCDESSLLGMTWESLFATLGQVRVLEQLRHGSKVEKNEYPQMMRFTRPDGTVVHALVTTVAEGGEYIIQIQDVAERERVNYQLGLLLHNTPVSIMFIDRAGRALFGGGGNIAGVIRGIRRAASVSVFDAFADYPAAMAQIRRALGGETISDVVEAYGHYIDMHLMPILDSGGKVMSVASIGTDVTDRYRVQAEQAAVAGLARRALDILEPDALWHDAALMLAARLDATITVHELNPYSDSTGPRLATLVGATPPAQVISTALEAAVCDGRKDGGSAWAVRGWSTMSVSVGQSDHPAAFLTAYRRRAGRQSGSGEAYDIRPSGSFTENDVGFIHAVADVLGSAAVRIAMEREIRHRSLHDPLTGLPNRAALLDQLRHGSVPSPHDRYRTGVIFIDLDGFKMVNDTYGHLSGDQVLCETAARLRVSVRPDDVVARLAGDEFAILCKHVETDIEVERVAHRVIAAVGAPIRLVEPGVTVIVTASAGVALSGAGLADPDRLLNASDIAMYAAKRAGRGLCVVDRSS